MNSAADAGAWASSHRLRVRYPETDRMGVVHHTHYFTWFELGRTELMRELGVPYGRLEDESGLYFPVVEARARYHVSARYDEELTVRTRIAAVRGATVRFDYEIRRDGASGPLATGFTEHATIGRDGRPLRIPAEVRARLAPQEASR